jgi:hypothetical protein
MPELRKHEGWAWSRLFRRWDTYAAHVAALEQDSVEQHDENLTAV